MKALSYAFLLVSAIVGAGFASGAEILTFFGDGNSVPIFVAPLAGILIFLCSCLFLFVAKKAKSASISEANKKILGHMHIFADIFLLFNSLVVLAGMLAAMDSLFNMLLPIAPAYSIISGILCALVVANGLKGLLKSNNIIMPIVILTIVLVCCFTIGSPTMNLSLRLNNISTAIIYVSMNMMLASTVFLTVKDLSSKQIILSSLIASAIITVLLTLVILAINSGEGLGSMPLVELAQGKSKALFYIALCALAVSIFTTMTVAMTGLNNWLSGLMGGGKLTVSIVLVAGLIVSNIGFDNVIAYLYPIVGAFGLAYIILCSVYLIRRKKSPPKAPLALGKNPKLR